MAGPALTPSRHVTAPSDWSAEVAERLLAASERAVMGAPSIREALRVSAAVIRAATGWAMAESYLFDAETASAELVATDHDGSEAMQRLAATRALESRGAVATRFAEQLQGGRALLIDPLAADRDVSRSTQALDEGITAVLAVPIFRHESPFALLVFADRRSMRGTSAADAVGRMVGTLTEHFHRRTRQIEFGGLWELSPDAMVILGTNGRVQEVNAAVTDMLGWSPADMLGKPGMRVVHPDDAPIAIDLLTRLGRGEHLERPVIVRIRKRDGNYAPIHVRSRALPSEASILLVGRDVSTVRHLEMENSRLARSYELMQRSNELGRQATDEATLFQRACDLAVEIGGYQLVWVGRVDSRTRTLEPVASAGDVTGYLEGLRITLDDDASGRGPSGRAVRQGRVQVSHDIQSDPTMTVWTERAIAADLRASAAFPMIVGDEVVGSMAFYSSSTGWFGDDEVRVLTDVVRNIAGAVEAMQLLASRQRAEASLRRLETSRLRNQRLESIGTLAGGIAHDLNNTLAPILMSAEMLDRTLETENHRSYVRIIETSARRGAALVRQVLGFARGFEGERVRLAATELVRDVCEMLGETTLKSYNITTEFEPELPELRGDPTQMQQVLLNLSVNAVQAMGATGDLRFRCERVSLGEEEAERILGGRAGDFVVITVSDTGAGISPEHLERIFDPFFTTKPQGTGTGLGLSTTLRIVRDHDGFIEVRSVVGVGSTFRVFLPVPVVEPEPSAVDDGLGADAPRGGDERILLIEEEGVVRALVREALERRGYRVEVAQDGADGAAVFAERSSEFALVITDVRVAVKGGIPMLHALQRLVPSVRAVALCAPESTAAEIGAAAGSEFVRVLRKPFEAHTLLRTVRDLLDATAATTP